MIRLRFGGENMHLWCTSDHFASMVDQLVLNSLTAIDAHECQRFNELCGTVVSCQVFIRSQSLIAR